jgi:hypothetical protein
MAILNNEAFEYASLVLGKTNRASEISRMLSEPTAFATDYNLPLTPIVEEEFHQAQARKEGFHFDNDDPVNLEVLSFFNIVVIDGRYIQEWAYDPENVALQLNLSVSPIAFNRIHEMQVSELVNMNLERAWWIPIVIFIVATLLTGDSRLYVDPLIVDRSTLNKV